MSKDSFGETLKRERELRGVTLDEISLATRIGTRFLKAIEEERWDELPGGVFNRGFVRAMARYIGLDEENTVAEYVLAIGDRATAPVVPPSPLVVTPQYPWLGWILVAVVVVSVVVTCWVGVRRIMIWRASRQTPHAAMVNSADVPLPSESPQLGPPCCVDYAPTHRAVKTSSGGGGNQRRVAR
jgi:cytoskeletal protein RodZ